MKAQTKKFSGVFAALLTPRKADDSVDIAALSRLVQFQLSKGVSSFALNGATGELCLAQPGHLRTTLETVRVASEGKATVLCGVGAPGVSLARELSAVAEEGGAAGLLLPMPWFFRYEQEDLEAFCKAVASGTKLPVLLYNLPQFCSALEKETIRKLIVDVPNIIGIKDSGGSLEILRDLTESGLDACRLVGNDPVLRPALSEGVCDGVVSGIACVLPELILALYAEGLRAAAGEFDDCWRLLREVAKKMDSLPTPWALKWFAEARGIFEASFAQPLSAERAAQGIELEEWFCDWFPSTVPDGAITS